MAKNGLVRKDTFDSGLAAITTRRNTRVIGRKRNANGFVWFVLCLPQSTSSMCKWYVGRKALCEFGGAVTSPSEKVRCFLCQEIRNNRFVHTFDLVHFDNETRSRRENNTNMKQQQSRTEKDKKTMCLERWVPINDNRTVPMSYL